ncbi:MAG: (Fe-S)-binding protein, partial [Nitrospinae bacterium]|nr:(Fe-S)-binding protein [Nitrospinota bacterium]
MTKPKRLTLSGEAILILLLILTIMISDIVYDGALNRLAMFPKEGEPAAYFLGFALAKIGMMSFSIDESFAILGAAYWTHILSILVFLVLLPRSKHFHIITSIPNVFLGNVTETGNQLHRIDFEDESKETFGVTRIEEFSWKKLLDLHTCTECGRCDVFCPALNSGKPLSPKQLTIDLRDHLNRETPRLLLAGSSVSLAGAGDAPAGAALMGGSIDDETVWSCTTCGACEEECPVMIEYVNKIIDLRQGLVMMDDRYPKELTAAFKSLETHSNPWGFPSDQRAGWAAGLGVKQWDKNNPTEYLYFVGCNGAFDTRGKEVAASVV